MSKLSIETVGDTEVVVKRRFNASPEEVYRAHTDPELIRQWMLGPDGWSMPVCISEAKPGGKIRYEWRNDDSEGDGEGFYLSGEFVELDPPRRIVHIERMHMPDPTPDNRIETTFHPDGDGTLLVVRMQLPSAEVRKAMLDTGMAMGMEASYDRVDALFI